VDLSGSFGRVRKLKHYSHGTVCLDGKADGHWSSTSEEITMLGGVPGLNGSTGGAGSGGVDLSQLQQIEQQALQDMLAISQNQIQFNTQMNQAKAVHQAANSFQLNA